MIFQNIFKTTPVDIKEVIIENKNIDTTKCNRNSRNSMMNELTILFKMATKTLKENIENYDYNEHKCVFHMVE